jgi:hypothetical protein
MLVVPFCISIPESDARKREPLSKMLREPSEEEAFALNGLEGEGREVESVSLTPVREEASAFPTTEKKRIKTTRINARHANFIHRSFYLLLA